MFEVEKEYNVEPKFNLTAFLRELDINDSFICPISYRSKITGSAGNIKLSNPYYKVITQKISETELKVIRIS